MARVKIVKNYKHYKQGETVEVTPNIAHGLIDSGIAILTKDIVSSDYSVKNEQAKPVKAKGQNRG